MKYEQLQKNYQDDYLADAMYAREAEWFHYDFDRANFVLMLEGMKKDDPRRQDLELRLANTLQQMDTVDRVYAAHEHMVTDQERHAAAVERTAARRAAPKG